MSTQGAIRSAHTTAANSESAARALVEGLGEATQPRVIVFFAGIHHDGATLGRALERAFPSACVLGCSTNGEFTDRAWGSAGAAALALGAAQVGARALVMADTSGDVRAGIHAAARSLSAQLGTSIAELDAGRFAGLALLEGARGREEQINAAFGEVAPFLPFVGGSAGDDITFSGTWTWAAGQLAREGTALLVAELLVPFRTFQTCHFVPTERRVLVTATKGRHILELDGEPAAAAYARAIGVEPEALDFPHFLANPLGLVIDGQAWLRSGVRREGDALFFACEVVPGTVLHYMRANDIVEDARTKLAALASELGGSLQGGIFFNCAYRMLEARLSGVEDAYHGVLGSVVHVGCQSNGESYLGHINQTLTGLVLGV
jgi:hypothetical protein